MSMLCVGVNRQNVDRHHQQYNNPSPMHRRHNDHHQNVIDQYNQHHKSATLSNYGSSRMRKHHRRAQSSSSEYPQHLGIKRILLTSYRRDDSTRDIGLKIIGGKLLPNGQLGAYVAAIHKGGLLETLGQVKVGDQILEWNGIDLSGKTYEEVQRIVSKSVGEIEVIVKSNTRLHESNIKPSQSIDKGYESATDISQHRDIIGSSTGSIGPPPVPAHRSAQQNSRHKPSSTDAINESYLRLAVSYDAPSCTLFVCIVSGRNLHLKYDNNRNKLPNPFVKIYLLPGRRVENKRRTKFVPNTSDPIWNQTVAYKDIDWMDFNERTLEFTVWDYDQYDNNFIGQVTLNLGDSSVLSGQAHWYSLSKSRRDHQSSIHDQIIYYDDLQQSDSASRHFLPIDVDYPAI